jgi:hypothetical protein
MRLFARWAQGRGRSRSYAGILLLEMPPTLVHGSALQQQRVVHCPLAHRRPRPAGESGIGRQNSLGRPGRHKLVIIATIATVATIGACGTADCAIVAASGGGAMVLPLQLLLMMLVVLIVAACATKHRV